MKNESKENLLRLNVLIHEEMSPLFLKFQSSMRLPNILTYLFTYYVVSEDNLPLFNYVIDIIEVSQIEKLKVTDKTCYNMECFLI